MRKRKLHSTRTVCARGPEAVQLELAKAVVRPLAAERNRLQHPSRFTMHMY